MTSQTTARSLLAFILLLFLVAPIHAAEQRIGFAVDVTGEGFFLNPTVKTLIVTEVIKGSLAEAAGMKVGDQIIQIEGQNVAGRRAWELRPFMKLNPGETRTLRLKHKDGTEVDARIKMPKA